MTEITITVPLGEHELVMPRHECSTCRGSGYVLTGAFFRLCPECLARDWAESAARLRFNFPPCYGYASCSWARMVLCPHADGCGRC